MPYHRTTLDLLGHAEPVSALWELEYHGWQDSYAQIVAVRSRLLGDLTRFLQASACADVGPHRTGFMLTHDLDPDWQDPIRTAMFGQVCVYRVGDPRVGPYAQPGPGPLAGLREPDKYVHQREPIRRTLSPHGTMHDRLRWEIEGSREFEDAMQRAQEDEANDDGLW